MKTRIYFLIASLFFTSFIANSQIVLSNNTAANHVATICGPGITYSNVTLTGSAQSIAKFIGGTSGGLGAAMNSGVVLSTGNVATPAVLQGAYTVFRSTSMGTTGITVLNPIAGVTTYDGITLEFDFVPITNAINVKYIFGSEEYNEYVNSGVNDAFAFFISGPGIAGQKNIAVIGASTPVTIDNINNGTNAGMYRDNTVLHNNNPMDGYTVQLTAAQAVQACQTYHIKLMIADGGDHIYDSWVFIQEQGLFAVGNPPVTLTGSSGGGGGTFPEGCTNASFTFSIPTAQATPYTFNVTWTGTATSGVDYNSLPTTITIPAGMTSVIIPITVLLDGITEGTETVICNFPATVCAPGQLVVNIIDANPLVVTASPDVMICNPGGNTSISASTTGGTGTVTYSWNPGGGTGSPLTVTPASTTTYTVTATDACNTTSTDQVIVTVSPLGAPVVTPTAETCANYNNGSVNINNAPGTGPYTVVINGPTTATVTEANTAAASANFTNLPDGNYTYTVTNASGCTYNGTFVITAGPPCCSVTAAGTNILCNGANTGTASATPTGLAPYSYSWTGGGSGQTATNLTAGSYTVTMTDASGCVATASVNITQPTAITGSLTPTHVTCNAACNGAIAVTASGGTPPYQYSNNGGTYQASNNFTGLCNGSYTIVVRDANNCTFTLTQNITQPAVLNLTQTAITQAFCGANNGSVTVSATGGTTPYQYSIDGGSNQASATLTGLAPGAHTVQVTDANGCTKTLNITITASGAPVASIQSQTNVSCFGGANGQVIIGLAGGVAPFTYSIGGPAQPSNTFSGLTAGSYTATVTDANGCSGTAPFTITAPTQLTFTATPTGASCNGICDGSIAVTASGGTAPYQYSSNNGITYQLSNSLTALCAGTIHVVIKDNNGCMTNNDIVVTQPAPLTATYANVDPICHDACDGQIVITPSGGTAPMQYGLNGGALQPSNSFNTACGGNNTVVIQDANGCQISSVQALVNPPGYGIDSTHYHPSNCGNNNGELTVVANGANGPFQYSINGGPFGPSGAYTGLFGGAYQITAIDQLGCTATQFFGINDEEMSGIVLLQTDATCFGNPDGTMEVTNVTGTLPITYELDNSGFTQSSGLFPGLLAGSHVVTIYDAGFCVFTIPFMVNEPAEIQYTTTLTNISCSGGNTGVINFTGVTGGTVAAGYQYSIDAGGTFQSSPNFTGLVAGTYDLVVMDDNGCMVFGQVTLTQAPPLAFNTSITDLLCFNDNTGLLQIGATGGTGAYQYSINNGSTFSPLPSFANIAAGTYNIVVQDAAGCQITGTATVNQPTQLTATYATTNALCNGSCDGTVTVTASGATAPYLYSPDNGLNFYVSNTLANLCAGTVSIRVKDANNCFINATQNISEPTAVTFTATPTDETCAASNGQIAFVASGGTPTYTYSIDNGATYSATATFTGLAANTYNVSVMDNNNCVEDAVVSISNQASPIIIGTSPTNVTCNAACDGQLQVTVSGGTGAITYSIGTPQASNTITNICAGNYTLTITDANGCTDTEPITITEPAVLTATVTPTDLTCNNNSTGQIAFVAAGGTTPYLYSTDGVAFSNNTTAQFLSAGTYNTVVKDNNGCLVNATVVVNEPTAMQIQNIATTNATCHSFCDGDATATVIGGTTGYTYSWSNGDATATATALCAGTYTLDVTDANGCTTSGNTTITEPPALTITNTATTDALCNGSCDGTITVTSPLATQFSSDGGTTYQASNVLTNLCAGTYTIMVQDATGCTATGSAALGEPQPVVQNAIPEDGMTICYNGNGTLSASATGGTAPYYFVWNTGDTAQYLNVNLTNPATFTCTVYDQNGCVSNVQTADVNIIPIFVASVTTPINTCPGQEVSFEASGSDGLPAAYGYNYEWFDSITMTPISIGNYLTIVPTEDQTFVMVAHDECNTYDTLTASVHVYSLPDPVFTVTPASGCSPLTAVFDLSAASASATASATWDFGDNTSGTGSTGVNHVYTEVGCYDVTVNITTTDGCVVDTTLLSVVCVNPDPIANFTWSPTPPTTVSSVINFTDQSINAATYSWNFGTFGTSTQQNPTLNLVNVEHGTYEVCLEVTSPDGCINEICKPVVIIEEFLIYVPNTFTPDGDEFNNIFTPIAPPGMTLDDYSFTIFDRWGEMIFESHNIAIGWDGTYHGQVVKEGTYTWIIQAKGAGDKKARVFKGHVNLLK